MNSLLVDDKEERLRKELEVRSEDCLKAAEFGKQLLEDKQELTIKYEQMCQQFVERIEDLEQDKHSMKLKADSKDVILNNTQTELNSLRDELNNILDINNTLKLNNIKQQRHTDRLNVIIDDLKVEVERERVNNKTHQLTIENVQRELSEQKMSTDTIHRHIKSDDTQNTSIKQLTAAKESAEKQVLHLKEITQHLDSKVRDQQDKLDRQNEQLLNKDEQYYSCYSSLENCRTQLYNHLESSKHKLDPATNPTTGNSLFGEVEDQRLALEKKYISLKVQHESLQRQQKLLKYQLHKYKTEMRLLLEQCGQQADETFICLVEKLLSERMAQIKHLTDKLNSAEKFLNQRDVDFEQHLLKYQQVFSVSINQKHFFQFLKLELTKSREKVSSLTSDLHYERLCRTVTSSDFQSTVKQLHTSDTTVHMLRAELLKQNLKIEELQLFTSVPPTHVTDPNISNGGLHTDPNISNGGLHTDPNISNGGLHTDPNISNGGLHTDHSLSVIEGQ